MQKKIDNLKIEYEEALRFYDMFQEVANGYKVIADRLLTEIKKKETIND